MERLQIKKLRKDSTLVWCFAVLFFWLFSAMIPRQVDDWYFWNCYRYLCNGTPLKDVIRSTYTVLNGRALGNGLLLFTSGSNALCALARTLAYMALLYGLGRLSRLRRLGGAGWAAVLFLLMAVPLPLLKETYAWTPGFFNFVFPAAMLLCYLLLIAPLFSGERIDNAVPTTAIGLLLGFASSLFAENFTVYAVAMAIGVVVWHIVCTRKISFVTLAYLIGAVIGAVVMFRCPAYLHFFSDNDGYYIAPTSIGMLLYVLKLNYPAFSYFSLENATLLQMLISGSALVLLLRKDGASTAERPALMRLRRILPVPLTALPAYFFMMSMSFDGAQNHSASFDALTQFFGSFYVAMAFDLILYMLYVASVACVLILFCGDARQRNLGLFAIASALVTGAPMLLVRPSSYRCFYVAYVMWALVALLLLSGALTRTHKLLVPYRALAARASYLVTAVICGMFLMLYAKCPKIERERIAYIEREMESHATEIVLPKYPCAEYLHLPDDAIGMYFNYGEWTDIQFQFLPYGEWKRTAAGE